MYSVYKIQNLITDEAYIGLSANPQSRFNAHLCKSNNKHLKASIEKYGKVNFSLSILKTEIKSKDDGHIFEGEFMIIYKTMYPNGFNINGSAAIKKVKANEFASKIRPHLSKIPFPFVSIHKATQISKGKISRAFRMGQYLMSEKEQELICNFLKIDFVPISLYN